MSMTSQMHHAPCIFTQALGYRCTALAVLMHNVKRSSPNNVSYSDSHSITVEVCGTHVHIIPTAPDLPPAFTRI